MAQHAESPAASWIETLEDCCDVEPPPDAAPDGDPGRAHEMPRPHDAAALLEGIGLAYFAQHKCCDVAGPAVEFGCGSAPLSLGLAAAGVFPRVILADPSPAPLRVAKDRADALGLGAPRLRFTQLKAEGIDRLPASSVSLFAMRSTLNRVADPGSFIRGAARALRPHGAMAIWEPCAEGYLLMGAAAQFIPMAAQSAGTPLSAEQIDRVKSFVESMKWYVRRDIDKSLAETRHVFRPQEIFAWAGRAGLSTEFFENRSFAEYARSPASSVRSLGFGWFLANYLEHAMGFDPDTVGVVRRTFAPQFCACFDELMRTGGGPSLTGIYLCRRRS